MDSAVRRDRVETDAFMTFCAAPLTVPRAPKTRTLGKHEEYDDASLHPQKAGTPPVAAVAAAQGRGMGRGMAAAAHGL